VGGRLWERERGHVSVFWSPNLCEKILFEPRLYWRWAKMKTMKA
jgi:hypothetical protein